MWLDAILFEKGRFGDISAHTLKYPPPLTRSQSYTTYPQTHHPHNPSLPSLGRPHLSQDELHDSYKLKKKKKSSAKSKYLLIF